MQSHHWERFTLLQYPKKIPDHINASFSPSMVKRAKESSTLKLRVSTRILDNLTKSLCYIPLLTTIRLLNDHCCGFTKVSEKQQENVLTVPLIYSVPLYCSMMTPSVLIPLIIESVAIYRPSPPSRLADDCPLYGEFPNDRTNWLKLGP